MKKWKIFCSMAALTILISISVLSCQTNDADDFPQEAVDLTAADLFIASEAYHKLEKEVGKDMRRERSAISKLSKEELERYRLLQKEMLNFETYADAIAQLKVLTGYDYQTNRDRISSLVGEVFKDVNFTKLELMRARQKSRMHKIAITRTETNEELRIQCKAECDKESKESIIWCTENFLDCVRDLPSNQYPGTPGYAHCEWVREVCLNAQEDRVNACKRACDESYPDEKK
ncbi:hypothetical protein [Bacteroides reticulotermitis]|uniref:Lipoprotein n=2 Tax=Bacteroides reticulotermitis TaxID=1133319 RepID=W4UVH8_9BACE|nr:hypothetical protein [Bacteroides reticulotermitis]MBB4044287.1 tryptophan 2,3-dioxygenase [Bacteroides reticulotermitis]GAE84832.1 hypothetical protein JCM10512_3203 [Bacteroides reticulotermitis JCM 10512]